MLIRPLESVAQAVPACAAVSSGAMVTHHDQPFSGSRGVLAWRASMVIGTARAAA